MSQQSPSSNPLDLARLIYVMVEEMAERIRQYARFHSDESAEHVRQAWNATEQLINEAIKKLPSGNDRIDAWLKRAETIARQFGRGIREDGLAEYVFKTDYDGFWRLAEEGRKLIAEIEAEQHRASQTASSSAAESLPRDEMERSRSADLAKKMVVVATAGDVWKSLSEGLRPVVAVSAISLRPQTGVNIAQPTFPQDADQAKWNTLETALSLCDAEGGDQAEAMRKLIAQVALANRVDRRQVINMPLAEFVEAAMAVRTGADVIGADDDVATGSKNEINDKAPDDVVAAVEALVEYVRKKNRHKLSRDGEDFAQLQELDTSAHAACGVAGLAIPQTRQAKNHTPFGSTHIPSLDNSSGFHVVATEDWLQCMYGVIAAAKALDREGRGAPPEQPERELLGRPPEESERKARERALASLQPAALKAYLAFQFAESKAGCRLEDKEAYRRLRDVGWPDDDADLAELTDYELPAFDTWSRQLRAARKPLGEQKNTPRAGRNTGGSVARKKET